MTAHLSIQGFVYSLPLCAAAMFMATPAAAENGVTVAVELGPEVVLTEETDVDSFKRAGFGAALRAGYTFDSPMVDVTPEAKFGFESPGTPNSFAALGGARVNFFEGISPAVFAHVGGLVGDLEGVVWDAGAGLDFTVIPLLDVGAFASYNSVGNAKFSSDRVSYQSTNWNWVQVGAQVAFHF